MWPSHSSSIFNPRASDYGTSKSNPRTNGKTPGFHENDPRKQITKIIPRVSKKMQTMNNLNFSFSSTPTNIQLLLMASFVPFHYDI